MFSNNNIQKNQQGNQAANQISTVKSAFRFTNLQGNKQDLYQLNHFNNLDKINTIYERQLSTSSLNKTLNQDVEQWSRAQIEKLFKLYDYYGPQWKVMSQHMPLRTANNLKNRFYTVLRNLIKLLFRKKAETCPKLSGQIPSKDLSRLYDGKQDYQQFKSLTKTILQQLDYDLQSLNIQFVVRKYSEQIIRIYRVIYGDRLTNISEDLKDRPRKTSQISPNTVTSTSLSNKGKQHEEYNRQNFQISVQPNLNISQQPNLVYFFFINPPDYYQVRGV